MKSRRNLKAVLLLTLFVVVIFICCGERFLEICSDAGDEKVDAVVVLGGGPSEDGVRVRKGAALVRSGRARYLILPIRHEDLDWKWFESNYDIRESLPKSQVLIGRVDRQSNETWPNRGGTYAEAATTVRMMAVKGFNSAIIISSGYHMRRARMAFKSVREDREMTLFFHPVHSENQDDEKTWWSKGQRLIPVLIEYCKLTAAFFLYQKT